jgi:hypothetical protein
MRHPISRNLSLFDSKPYLIGREMNVLLHRLLTFQRGGVEFGRVSIALQKISGAMSEAKHQGGNMAMPKEIGKRAA